MKAVLFDWDGTIVDSYPSIGRLLDETLRHVGIEVPADKMRPLLGLPLADCFVRCGVPESQVDGCVEHYIAQQHARAQVDVELFPGARDGLMQLENAGIALGVASSKGTVSLGREIEELGMISVFSVVSAPPDGVRKEKKWLILDALATLDACLPGGVSSGEVLMVGDRWMDVEGARENNMSCIGVRWGYGDDAEFEGASHIVDSWPELTDLLLVS